MAVVKNSRSLSFINLKINMPSSFACFSHKRLCRILFADKASQKASQLSFIVQHPRRGRRRGRVVHNIPLNSYGILWGSGNLSLSFLVLNDNYFEEHVLTVFSEEQRQLSVQFFLRSDKVFRLDVAKYCRGFRPVGLGTCYCKPPVDCGKR